jgi:hypothetical protein
MGADVGTINANPTGGLNADNTAGDGDIDVQGAGGGPELLSGPDSRRSFNAENEFVKVEEEDENNDVVVEENNEKEIEEDGE